LSLTKTGAFTGTLRFAGRALPLKGDFDAFGQHTGVIEAGGAIGTLFIFLQFQPESKTIMVQISRELSEDEAVESSGLAERSTWSSANPCRFAAAYTTALPKPEPPGPQGDGSAQIALSRRGTARLIGKLGDGSTWSASARITDSGILSLYTSLYRTRGSISGPLTFVNRPVLKGTGPLFWSKPDEFTALLDTEANAADGASRTKRSLR
jgi:hypothetical protein